MHSNGLPTKLGKLIVRNGLYNLDFIKKLPKIVIYDLKYDVIKDQWEIIFHHESLREMHRGMDVYIYDLRPSEQEGVDEYEFYY